MHLALTMELLFNSSSLNKISEDNNKYGGRREASIKRKL